MIAGQIVRYPVLHPLKTAATETMHDEFIINAHNDRFAASVRVGEKAIRVPNANHAIPDVAPEPIFAAGNAKDATKSPIPQRQSTSATDSHNVRSDSAILEFSGITADITGHGKLTVHCKSAASRAPVHVMVQVSRCAAD